MAQLEDIAAAGVVVGVVVLEEAAPPTVGVGCAHAGAVDEVVQVALLALVGAAFCSSSSPHTRHTMGKGRRIKKLISDSPGLAWRLCS